MGRMEREAKLWTRASMRQASSSTEDEWGVKLWLVAKVKNHEEVKISDEEGLHEAQKCFLISIK